MTRKEIEQELVAAGYTIIRTVKPARWYEVEKNGEPAAILFQYPNAWHWFGKRHEATASGGSAKQADRGGLGDAIDDDRALNRYRQLMIEAPDDLLRSYAAVFRASSDCFNEQR